jgi:hypothetical protein
MKTSTNVDQSRSLSGHCLPNTRCYESLYSYLCLKLDQFFALIDFQPSDDSK